MDLNITIIIIVSTIIIVIIVITGTRRAWSMADMRLEYGRYAPWVEPRCA